MTNSKTAFSSDIDSTITQNDNNVNNNFVQNQDRDLVAIHNLKSEEFEKTLNLGGFPIPSIAVTKDDFLHKGYGDISVIFSRDTIDPKRAAANKVYGGDAWTPSYPQVEYKINSKKANEIYRKANDIGQVPFFNPVNLHPDNVEDTINRSGNQSSFR